VKQDGKNKSYYYKIVRTVYKNNDKKFKKYLVKGKKRLEKCIKEKRKALMKINGE